MEGKAWTTRFLRFLTWSLYGRGAGAAWYRGFSGISPSPHPSLTQGEGGSSPRGGLSFVLTTALPRSLRETWTLQLPAWGSHGIFLPILQMRKLRPRVICPSSHRTPSLLTPGPGPLGAVVGGVGRLSISPSEEGMSPLRGEWFLLFHHHLSWSWFCDCFLESV